MIRLFNRTINVNDANPANQQLLKTISEFQASLSATTGDVRGRITSSYNPEQDWRERHAMWEKIKMTQQQCDELTVRINAVGTALAAAFPTLDLEKRYEIDCFSNTIVDILIQSIYDNNIMASDHLVQNMLYQWEETVIIPLFLHLRSTNNLAVLNNEPLIGEATCMEKWVVFKGDSKRGMFQTLGSALAKGFYRALNLVVEMNDPALNIPSSLLGNLTGYGLHATQRRQQEEVMELMSALMLNTHYHPSAGVYQTIAAYQPGQIGRAKVDVVNDNTLNVNNDLRDKDVVSTVEWQRTLLSAASSVLDHATPLFD